MKPSQLPRLAAFVCAGLLIVVDALGDTSSHGSVKTITADEALTKLLEGNKRFVTGKVNHPDQDASRRLDQSKGQTPTAIVLACSDSRVSPELLFDQGIGSIFVIRNAGNVLDSHVIGSMEYAVAHLHVPLILVLGHAKCGAVSAAVEGGHAPGHIGTIVESLEPAVKAAAGEEGDKVDNTVRANATSIREALAACEPILAKEVKAGKVKVFAGRYDITTGEVGVLP